MKVSIRGLENSAQTEKLRDSIAQAVTRELRTQKIKANISEIIIDCSHTLDDTRATKTQDKTTSFDHLLITPKTNSNILVLPHEQQTLFNAQLKRWELFPLIHNKWELYKIEPSPILSLNFVGSSGTGKTLAAHNFASKLNKKIIEVSYADVVSKYFGEAAKNLSALFAYAQNNDAVLFIDEAETLLSKRNISANDGADHAVNSMRSQLLLLLQNTPIISIFASNLVEGYDPAFLTRLTTIHFPKPDEIISKLIWAIHIPDALPIKHDITPELLAKNFPGLTGRQISKIIIHAAYRAAEREEKEQILSFHDFSWAHELVLTTGQ